MGVAQVVEPNVRQTRTLNNPGQQLTDRLRMQRFAAGVCEDRVACPNAMSVVALPIAPAFEDVFGVGAQFEAAPGTGDAWKLCRGTW